MNKIKHVFSSYWTWAILLLLVTIGFYPFVRYILCLTNQKDIIDAYVILGSFISGAAFIGFLHATRLQREQLKLQTDEITLQRRDLEVQQELLKETIAESKDQNRTIALQRFENTFFKLIESLNQGLDYVHFSNSGVKHNGRLAFKKVYDLQKEYWESFARSQLGAGRAVIMKESDYQEYEVYINLRLAVYKEFASWMKREFYNYNQTHFETILTCVELIKRNRPILGSEFDEYHRILLAQLSIYEKWELFIYVDAFDHLLRSHLRGNNFFRDLTDKNFVDPEIFRAFNTI